LKALLLLLLFKVLRCIPKQNEVGPGSSSSSKRQEM
jgi:hypothetical protein